MRLGVQCHGHGKWKKILSDDKFGNILATRSNVDLKVRTGDPKDMLRGRFTRVCEAARELWPHAAHFEVVPPSLQDAS